MKYMYYLLYVAVILCKPETGSFTITSWRNVLLNRQGILRVNYPFHRIVVAIDMS